MHCDGREGGFTDPRPTLPPSLTPKGVLATYLIKIFLFFYATQTDGTLNQFSIIGGTKKQTKEMRYRRTV